MPSFLFVLVCGVVSPLAARKRTSETLGMVCVANKIASKVGNNIITHNHTEYDSNFPKI